MPRRFEYKIYQRLHYVNKNKTKRYTTQLFSLAPALIKALQEKKGVCWVVKDKFIFEIDNFY